MTGRTRPLALVPGLLELAERQAGVVHRRQLAALGVDEGHVRSHVRAQRWAAIGSQVVALMTGPLGHEQMLHVALLHGGDQSRLDGLTALAVHGLVGWAAPAVEVLVPHGVVVSRLDGIVVHRSRHLDDVDLTRRRGFACSTAARATVDAASRQRSRRSAAGLVFAVVQQRLSTPDELQSCLGRLTKVRYVDTIRDAAQEAAGGSDAQSESDVARLLRRAGLGPVRRQFAVETIDGNGRFDLAVALPDGSLLLVEVDGPHHDAPAQRAADLAKDAAAVALGHQVLRIPVHLVRPQSARILAQFEQIRRAAQNRFGSENPQ